MKLIDLQEKVVTKNNIHFHIIPTKKFKTVNFVMKCKAPLDRSTITKRALLPFILQKGTKSYPSEKKLMNRLDELYGASLYIEGAKKGNNHIISFRLEVANENYLPTETPILQQAISLFQEIIFSPRIENSRFIETVVEREKQTLENKIKAIFDNKLVYANNRLIEEMCNNERFQIHKDGYIEDLPKINGQNLFEYYQQLLKEDRMDLYVLGDFDIKNMENLLIDSFSRESEQPELTNTVNETPIITELKEVKETQPVQQAKLHIGYRTNCTYKDDDYFALQVFNGIFGGFPSSKLFVNVREKHSLAYYAASRIESHKGLLIVYSGIAPEDEKKAREIIDLQLEAMKKGDFTEEQVNSTKELIISELKETLDSSYGIPELLYQQVIGEKEVPPHQYMERINKVTKEDVVKIANKITPDTVFLLTNDGSEKVETSSV